MAIKASRDSKEAAPHPLDIALGARVRLRRKELGYSQDKLARSVGIAFQQVQKYEHGTNRISFSRLAEIAEALDCSIADLIAGLDKSKPSAAMSRQLALLTQSGARELIQAHGNIQSAAHRRTILNLARELGRDYAETARGEVPARRAGAPTKRGSRMA